MSKDHLDYVTVNASELFTSDADAGFRYRAYPGGAMIVTSELNVHEPTEFHFQADPNGHHISAQYFLRGEASIRMGDGTVGFWTENGMSIIRSDTPGFRLRVEAGQTLRHVCVAMYQHDLGQVQAHVSDGPIAGLMASDAPVDMAVPVPAGPQARSKAEQLHALSHLNGISELRAEALAMEFLADALERLSALTPGEETPGDPAPWQREAAREIKQLIDADPIKPVMMEEIFSRFGMSEAMTLRIFRNVTGLTLTAYLRQARLRWARRELEDGKAVKVIAFACGYTHVGNFTRAYRQAFGEAPNETRRNAARR